MVRFPPTGLAVLLAYPLAALLHVPAALGQMVEAGVLARSTSNGEFALGSGEWTDRLSVLRRKSLPAVRSGLERAGWLERFRSAADPSAPRRERPEPGWADAEVYAWIEAVACSIVAAPGSPERAGLEEEVGRVVEIVLGAQREDGYVHTATQLAVEGQPFGDLQFAEEGLCAARLLSAGLALERATGDVRLRGAGVRFAQLWKERFGAERRSEIAGGPGLEFALCELARISGQEDWLELAARFVERRGSTSRPAKWGRTWHDELPVLDAREAWGELAGAARLFAGVAAIGALSGWEDYLEASVAMGWDVARRKSLVGGAIAGRGRPEFGAQYATLPQGAQAPTVATLELVPLYRALARQTTHALWFDQLELLWHNAARSAVTPDGERFAEFLPTGGAVGEPVPWFAGQGSPAGLVRLLPTIGDDAFLYDPRNVWTGVYVSGEARLMLDGGELRIIERATLLEDGKVELELQPAGAFTFTVHVRVPRWARSAVRVGVNGQLSRIVVEHGDEPGTYLSYERVWKRGDTISLELPLDGWREAAAKDDARVVVGRGPEVLVLDARDHPGLALDQIALPDGAELAPTRHAFAPGSDGHALASAAAVARWRSTRSGAVVDRPATMVLVPWWSAGLRGPSEVLLALPRAADRLRAPPMPPEWEEREEAEGDEAPSGGR